MRIRTMPISWDNSKNDEGYILTFYDENNPPTHKMEEGIFSVTEITLNSKEELLRLRECIDAILNLEEGKAKSHKRK